MCLSSITRAIAKCLLTLGCLATLGALGSCGPAPDVRHYKLVVYVETSEGVKTGVSVIEVKYGHDIKALGWMGAGGASVAGEAVAVDLPHGQTLWLLLSNAASADSWGVNLGYSLPPVR